MRIDAALGPTTIRSREGTVRFVPRGSIYEYGPRRNPATRREGPSLLSARLFVGLNVGDEERWTVDDVADVVLAARRKQKRSASASFLLQRGIYQPRTKRGYAPAVEEKSVQILIFNDDELSRREFGNEMIKLAEVMARKLRQEVIYLDIQRRGVVVDSYTVKP